MSKALVLLSTAAIVGFAQSPSGGSRPMLDLNKPIENPALVHAMEGLAAKNSAETQKELLGELRRANFLALMLSDGLKRKESAQHSQVLIEKGSRFSLLVFKKDGKLYLPLFTDWSAINASGEKGKGALVLPASDAWEFVLRDSTYSGVVINPAHNALPLERRTIERLVLNAK